MKPRLLSLSIFFLLLLGVLSVSAYHVFSYSKQSLVPSDLSPVITLVLPDQDYVITTRDLESLDSKLVIPTLDNATPTIVYNENLGVLESLITPQDYIIDVEVLKAKVAQQGDPTMAFVPTYILRDRFTTSLADYNSQLNYAYRNPLTINLKDGGEFSQVTLDPSIIRQIIRPISTDFIHPLDVDKETLIGYLSERLTAKQKQYFNPTVAYQNTKNALNSRFMGKNTPVVLGVDDGPTSRGELADRYLEVDLSQQKMYFFINHALYKEYKVSTGAEYPTPVGEFHILNKAESAFSAIYNAWMPYWMGFTYASDVGAYLGLHEIAYAVDEKGNKLYRYGNYIGDMMTGGCVAMEPKDSREIYNLSEVGMLVRIVK